MNQTMKSLLPFVLLSFSLFLLQCTSKEKQTVVATEDTTRYEAGIIEPEKVDLKGDFNGDGKTETAVLRLIKEGEIQSTPWIYTLVFSDPAIQSFTFDNYWELPLILNDGPLNNTPGDELTIVETGFMMGTAIARVYSLSGGMWGKAMGSFGSRTLLPDSLGFEDLVFADSGNVFYYEFVDDTFGGVEEPDADDREAGFYKTEAKLFTAIEPMSNRFLEEEIVGSMDVDGDGIEEMMRITTVFDNEESPTKRLEFSNPSIKPMALSDTFAEVIVEGDLDGVQGSELSILDYGIMPNYNYLMVFSYVNGRWKNILEGPRTRTIMPDGLTREDLIFREREDVYYYEDEELDNFNGSKENMKKVKAEMK